MRWQHRSMSLIKTTHTSVGGGRLPIGGALAAAAVVALALLFVAVLVGCGGGSGGGY